MRTLLKDYRCFKQWQKRRAQVVYRRHPYTNGWTNITIDEIYSNIVMFSDATEVTFCNFFFKKTSNYDKSSFVEIRKATMIERLTFIYNGKSYDPHKHLVKLLLLLLLIIKLVLLSIFWSWSQLAKKKKSLVLVSHKNKIHFIFWIYWEKPRQRF